MIYLFHSWEFLAFYGVILAAHWALPHRFRNALLLAASCFFYGAAGWRFLALLVASSFFDFVLALKIHGTPDGRRRRAFLVASVAGNLALFGFFKYFNFFNENITAFLGVWHVALPTAAWRVVLPLGLSFYTFQKMAYTIDVYRRKIEPAGRLSEFLLFMSFFPQLIVGPIEKAGDLLPQLRAQRRWRDVKVRESVYWYVYGLFKKVVIADSLGRLVDAVFALSDPSGGQVLLAVYAFTVQLYCDFSGYSDMAVGLAGLLGVRLRVNFDLPFFSTNYFEFYRRWHVTLSEWAEEYIYTPLSYYIPRRLAGRTSLSTGAVMLIGSLAALFVTRMAFALWYGAAWNFVVLGVYIFGCQVVTGGVVRLARRFVDLEARLPPRVSKALGMAVLWNLFAYAMLLFRSDGIGQAWRFTRALLWGISWRDMVSADYWPFYVTSACLFAYEAWQHRRQDLLVVCRGNFYVQSAFYLALFFLYIQIGAVADQRFIYFQF